MRGRRIRLCAGLGKLLADRTICRSLKAPSAHHHHTHHLPHHTTTTSPDPRGRRQWHSPAAHDICWQPRHHLRAWRRADLRRGESSFFLSQLHYFAPTSFLTAAVSSRACSASAIIPRVIWEALQCCCAGAEAAEAKFEFLPTVRHLPSSPPTQVRRGAHNA